MYKVNVNDVKGAMLGGRKFFMERGWEGGGNRGQNFTYLRMKPHSHSRYFRRIFICKVKKVFITSTDLKTSFVDQSHRSEKNSVVNTANLKSLKGYNKTKLLSQHPERNKAIMEPPDRLNNLLLMK